MNVFLTVDVETYTGDYAGDIRGAGLGLDYVLSTCDRFGIKATFFVEALGATRWGLPPLKEICGLIQSAGHEIQLHLHPVVAQIEGFTDRFDTLWRQDCETQVRLIRKGLEILASCSTERISAFRAGALAANEDTLRAMCDNGILLGSNRDLDVKSSIESKVNDSFPVRNDISTREGLTDLPVSALRSPLPGLDGRYRHLEICAVGFLEMRDALEKMQEAGYACATILTHPQEFFRMTRKGALPVMKNRRRLEQLLAWLSSRPAFRTLTIGQCLAHTAIPLTSPPELRFHLGYSMWRVCEQAAQRISTVTIGNCCEKQETYHG